MTPEDIGAARDAGAGGAQFLSRVLVAIATRRAEDVSLCAFVATEERGK